MNKKRICFIAQFPPPIHGLSKAVETLYNSRLADEFDLEKVDITNNKRILSNLLKIWKSKADLFYFTISQSKGGNLRDLAILKLLEKQKKKCIIHLHGGYYRQLVDHDLPDWQKKANYNAISKIAGAIVLGPSLKWIFQGMLPEEKIFTVPNCIENEYLMSEEEFEKKEQTITERRIKHILYLSNFMKSKGYREVLEMIKLEKERVDAGQVRKFHFDFAGQFFEKEEEEFFRSYIKQNQIEKYITYHGVVSGDEKRKLFRQCDVFILLSRNEGQPISILEAMGNGYIIITTNCGGIPDIVEDKKNGIIVSMPIQTKAIYDRLFQYNDSEIMTIQKYNRQLSATRYIESSYIDNMTKVFKSYYT